MATNKTCTSCRETKNTELFPGTRYRGMRQDICKLCRKNYRQRKVYAFDPEYKNKRRTSTKKWQRRQREKLTYFYIRVLLLGGLRREGKPLTEPTKLMIKKKRRVMVKERRAAKIEAENPDRRVCRTCYSLKPLADFWNDKSGRKGKMSSCIVCTNKRQTREAKHHSDNLTDRFIVMRLCDRSQLRRSDIPDELIELKRSEYAARRAIKNDR